MLRLRRVIDFALRVVAASSMVPNLMDLKTLVAMALSRAMLGMLNMAWNSAGTGAKSITTATMFNPIVALRERRKRTSQNIGKKCFFLSRTNNTTVHPATDFSKTGEDHLRSKRTGREF